jgi:hypothetical protein
MDNIVVASPDFAAVQIAAALKIINNLLNSPNAESHVLGNYLSRVPGVSAQVYEYPAVVG